MTRIVLYDRELHEALTVIEVPASWVREAREEGRRHWRLAVPTYVSVETVSASLAQAMETRVVTIALEAVARGREIIFWYAYPDDPELALELRAAFLPGQLGEVQRRARDAFWRGVFTEAALGPGRR